MKRRRQRGHAMLELALAATMMVSCLAGTFQFGYAFYVYNQLVTAVGNGGRYAATRTLRAATEDDVEKGREAIRNMVVFGDPAPAQDAAPVVPGLTPERVDVTWVEGQDSAPEAVRVSIREYPVSALFGSFTLAGKPSVQFPFVGRYAPQEREPGDVLP